MIRLERWIWRGMSLVLIWGVVNAEARSTFNARFAFDAIAGPGIVQVVPLFVHLFPGDGEAILECDLEVDPAAVELISATSTLGKVISVTPSLLIDYRERPAAGEQIDTVHVTISSRAMSESAWTGRIVSSARPEGPPAHVGRFRLGVEPKLEFAIGLEPTRLFPGQLTEVVVTVANNDQAGRALKQIDWIWPASFVVQEGEPRYEWAVPLAAGETDTLLWQVEVDGSGIDSARLEISGLGATERLNGSPFDPVFVTREFLPRVEARMASPFMELGRAGEIVFVWSNTSSDTIEIDEFELQIPEAFTDVQLVDGGPKAEMTTDDKGRTVVMSGVGELVPGGEFQLRLDCNPTLPGRFSWPSRVVPANHFWKITLPDDAVVPVALPGSDEAATSADDDYLTDLQMLGGALSLSLDRQLASLSLPAGTVIHLRPDSEKEKNWIVEDALTQALIARGYEISLVDFDGDGADGGILSYRLVDTRVVYSPNRTGFLRNDGRKSREAFGDLFLTLQLEGKFVWTSRVPAYARDAVPSDHVDMLGGSDIVERTVVQADNKLVARTLSASILGGLLYIFFVP